MFRSGTGGGSLAHDSYDFLNGAKLTGSIMIFESESIEAVRKIIEDDVYWTEPVVCVQAIAYKLQSIN